MFYKRFLNLISIVLMLLAPVKLSGQDVASDSTLKEETRLKEITGGYYFDTFSQPYNRFWQVFSAGAGFGLPFGPVSTGINYGHMNDGGSVGQYNSDYQLLAEAYPTITKRIYGYFAYGYSPGKFFPQHRGGAALWYSLNKGWVISGGANYYYFDRNILVPFVAIEKYSGFYWFTSKINFHNKEAGLTTSLFISARRYLNDLDYFQVTVGAGTAPDEPYNIVTDLERQQAYSLKLLLNKGVGEHVVLKSGVGFSLEEYAAGMRRNRYEGLITITYKINSSK